MFDIELYLNNKGKSEVEEYLKELKRKNNKDSRIKFNKITAYIDALARNGLSLNEKYIEHIEDEIWELRPLRDRIFFASYQNNKFILLSVFIKKTQKTPKLEIEKAKRLLKNYKEGMNRNGKI